MRMAVVRPGAAVADKAGPGPAVLEMVITSQRQVGGSTASGEERCSSGHHNQVYI